MKKLTIKHMSVRCINGILHYTRKLEDGPGEDMYGLEVCKLFDFSNDFLENAHKIRRKYNKNHRSVMEQETSKYNVKKIKGKCEFCGKESRDIHHLQPQELADINNYIDSIHKNHPANLVSICVKCHKKETRCPRKVKNTKTTCGMKLIEQ